MQITDVEAIPLRVGPTLVRVHTDEGITGLGEASYISSKILKPFVEDVLKPIVVGKAPRLTNRIWEEMFFETARLGPMGIQSTSIGAIDVACWDILGKSLGIPVYNLLAGAARTHVKLYWSTGLGWDMEPREMLSKVEEGYDLGFRAFKIRMDWSVSNQQKWDTLEAERSGAGWRFSELPEGPVVASSLFDRLSLHLLPAL